MQKSTDRASLCFGAVAILLCASCSDRSALRGTGGAGGVASATGGTLGSGGSGVGSDLSGSGGVNASGSGGIASIGLGSGGLGAGGALGVGASWGGDGIWPPGRGGSLGAGGFPDGNAGSGGVDPNCFMRCGQGNAIYYTGGAGGSAGARIAGAGGAGGSADARTGADAVDCEAQNQLYSRAVAAAGQCDPTAAEPCAAYQGVNCPPVGVSPDSVTALTAQLSAMEAGGCALRATSCPIVLIKPAPYTCQAGADGVYRCYSICGNLASGRATCVSQSTGCSGVLLTAGYCASSSTVCCSSQ